MKRVTYKAGKYSTIEIDKTRFFLEALLDSVLLRKMRFKLLPGDIVWQYQFPFYIRTMVEAWELSEEIIKAILAYLEKCSSAEELLRCANDEIIPFLDNWVELNKNRADKVGFDKLGIRFMMPKGSGR